MITIELDSLNPEQLAQLYKAMIQLGRYGDADKVYKQGIITCGVQDFCMEVARTK